MMPPIEWPIRTTGSSPAARPRRHRRRRRGRRPASRRPSTSARSPSERPWPRWSGRVDGAPARDERVGDVVVARRRARRSRGPAGRCRRGESPSAQRWTVTAWSRSASANSECVDHGLSGGRWGIQAAQDGAGVGVQCEDLVEALLQAAPEALGLGDRGRVEVHADAARVAVGDERDHRRAAGQRRERVGALDLRAGDVDVLADAGDVAGLQVVGLGQVAGDLRDHRRRAAARAPARRCPARRPPARSRAARTCAPIACIRSAGSACRPGPRAGRAAKRLPPCALVGLAAHGDRDRHRHRLDRVPDLLVVEAEAAEQRGDEGVVERCADGLGRRRAGRRTATSIAWKRHDRLRPRSSGEPVGVGVGEHAAQRAAEARGVAQRPVRPAQRGAAGRRPRRAPPGPRARRRATCANERAGAASCRSAPGAGRLRLVGVRLALCASAAARTAARRRCRRSSSGAASARRRPCRRAGPRSARPPTASATRSNGVIAICSAIEQDLGPAAALRQPHAAHVVVQVEAAGRRPSTACPSPSAGSTTRWRKRGTSRVAQSCAATKRSQSGVRVEHLERADRASAAAGRPRRATSAPRARSSRACSPQSRRPVVARATASGHLVQFALGRSRRAGRGRPRGAWRPSLTTASTSAAIGIRDVVLGGELHHRARGLDALGDLAHLLGDLVERLVPARAPRRRGGCATAGSCTSPSGRRGRSGRRTSAGRRPSPRPGA